MQLQLTKYLCLLVLPTFLVLLHGVLFLLSKFVDLGSGNDDDTAVINGAELHPELRLKRGYLLTELAAEVKIFEIVLGPL